MLNREQVRELFLKEAILIKDNDVVPLYRVVELFGMRAAGFAERACCGISNFNFNCYGVGGFTVPYLTYEGFKEAASFANIEEIRDSIGKPADFDLAIEAGCAVIPDHIRKDIQELKYKYPGESDWCIISDIVRKAAMAAKKKRRDQKHEKMESGTG